LNLKGLRSSLMLHGRLPTCLDCPSVISSECQTIQ